MALKRDSEKKEVLRLFIKILGAVILIKYKSFFKNAGLTKTFNVLAFFYQMDNLNIA